MEKVQRGPGRKQFQIREEEGRQEAGDRWGEGVGKKSCESNV